LKYTSSKYKGIEIEYKQSSTNKNKSGSENITREYEDMIKKDWTNKRLTPLTIEANSPNTPMLKGPKRR